MKTTCPKCREVMRRWARAATHPPVKLPGSYTSAEQFKVSLLRVAISFRDGGCDWHNLTSLKEAS